MDIHFLPNLFFGTVPSAYPKYRFRPLNKAVQTQSILMSEEEKTQTIQSKEMHGFISSGMYAARYLSTHRVSVMRGS